jgi:hypothetical protein
MRTRRNYKKSGDIWVEMGCPSVWPKNSNSKGLTREIAALPIEARWRFFLLVLDNVGRRIEAHRFAKCKARHA